MLDCARGLARGRLTRDWQAEPTRRTETADGRGFTFSDTDPTKIQDYSYTDRNTQATPSN